jgi:DNA-binding LacI/PurR family transcriptional regulator
VLAAALQLKYQPNPLARALASGRSRLLGAVTLRLTCGSRAFIDFEQAARRADYSVCVTTLDEPCEASVSTAVEHLRRHGAAGLAIIAPCTLPLPAARLLAQVVPIRLVKNGRAGTAGARALIRDIEGIVATDPQCIDTLSSD